MRRERDWEVLPSTPLWGNCIYLFLILTESCTFLHTHLFLKYVHFSPTSSHGNNDRNTGSFFPTKYYLFCINCPYFSSITDCSPISFFCAFMQNEKIVDEWVPLQFLCAVSISRNWQDSKWIIYYSIWFFPPFYVYWLYEIKKEKVTFSSLLSINQKTGMTLKRGLNNTSPVEITQKENTCGFAMLKSKNVFVGFGFF